MISGVKNDLSAELIGLLEVDKIGALISVETKDDIDVLTVDISPIEVPQYPVFEVKKTERVIIKIKGEELPEVFCRKDFPIVPHLNVLEDEQKTLCLFDVSFNEIKHMFNASVLIKRIVYWFEKTARGELHQPDQPMEPYFPYVTNAMFLSLKNQLPFVRMEEIPNENYRILKEVPLNAKDCGKVYSAIVAKVEKNADQNIINSLPKNLENLDEAFDDTLIDKISKLLPLVWAVKQKEDIYRLLFNQSESELKKSSVVLVVDIVQKDKRDSGSENHTYKAFLIECTFQTLYKSLGYRVEKNKLIRDSKSGDFSSIKLSAFETFFYLDTNSANLYNGLDEHICRKRFLQIGVGSLGSQIANNCIRAGYGEWVYVDPDILFPHNLARHCLTKDGLGKSKALLMKEYSDNILDTRGQRCVNKAICENIYNSEFMNDFIKEIESVDLVVDCSASIAVERYVCHKLANKTRCMSAFMNPSGTDLVVLIEDSERKVQLDTLEMQYYSILINNEFLRNHLKSEQKVIYSSSCRNESLKYSQDNVAVFSGIASKLLKNIHHNNDANVLIWTFDGLSIKSINEQGVSFACYSNNGWSVKFSSLLEQKLFSLRNDKLPNETGGVLIGAFDYERKICYIVDTVKTPHDSQEYPYAFIRGSKGLLSEIERIEEVTAGNLTYIGEWHSHPTDNTNQSSDDKILLRYISEYNSTNCAPGCMIIVGETHLSVYID